MAKRHGKPKGKSRRKKVRKAFTKTVAAGLVSVYIILLSQEDLQAGLIHWLQSCFNN